MGQGVRYDCVNEAMCWCGDSFPRSAPKDHPHSPFIRSRKRLTNPSVSLSDAVQTPKYNTYRKNPPFLTGLLSFDDSSGSPYDDDDGHDLRSGAPATDTRDMG